MVRRRIIIHSADRRSEAPKDATQTERRINIHSADRHFGLEQGRCFFFRIQCIASGKGLSDDSGDGLDGSGSAA